MTKRNDIKHNIKKLLCSIIALVPLMVLAYFWQVQFGNIGFLRDSNIMTIKDGKDITIGVLDNVNTFSELQNYKKGKYDATQVCREVMDPVLDNIQIYRNCVWEGSLGDLPVFVRRDNDVLQGSLTTRIPIEDKYEDYLSLDFQAEIREDSIVVWFEYEDVWYERAFPLSEISLLQIEELADARNEIEYKDFPEAYSDELIGVYSCQITSNRVSGRILGKCAFADLDFNGQSYRNIQNFGSVHIYPMDIPKNEVVVVDNWKFLYSPEAYDDDGSVAEEAPSLYYPLNGVSAQEIFDEIVVIANRAPVAGVTLEDSYAPITYDWQTVDAASLAEFKEQKSDEQYIYSIESSAVHKEKRDYFAELFYGVEYDGFDYKVSDTSRMFATVTVKVIINDSALADQLYSIFEDNYRSHISYFFTDSQSDTTRTLIGQYNFMRTQVGIVTNAMPDGTYEIGLMLPVSYVSQAENIEETDAVEDSASQSMENNA